MVQTAFDLLDLFLNWSSVWCVGLGHVTWVGHNYIMHCLQTDHKACMHIHTLMFIHITYSIAFTNVILSDCLLVYECHTYPSTWGGSANGHTSVSWCTTTTLVQIHKWQKMEQPIYSIKLSDQKWMNIIIPLVSCMVKERLNDHLCNCSI